MPENIAKDITASNEKFTLQMNITSCEFMEFIHKVVMIDPPPHLKS